MVAEPFFSPVATPVALIVATAVSDELQLAELLRSLVLPSLNLPVAVNGCVAPPAAIVIDGLAGVTCID